MDAGWETIDGHKYASAFVVRRSCYEFCILHDNLAASDFVAMLKKVFVRQDSHLTRSGVTELASMSLNEP